MSQTPTKDRRVEWLKTAMMCCPCEDGLNCRHGQPILALLNAQGWQPIDTAPKDHLPILVLANGRQMVAVWHFSYQKFISVPGRYDLSPVAWHALPAPPVDATGVKP